MGLNWPDNNHNYVPAYQMSGLPYVTGTTATGVSTTPLQIKFPYVTRWIYVRNTGAQVLRLGFTELAMNGPLSDDIGDCGGYNVTGSNRNYINIPAGNQATMMSDLGPLEIKCTKIFLRSHTSTTGFELIAGYTAIPENQMLVLTGANGFQGVG